MSSATHLITGASRGIGAALAVELAAPGRVIGINYRSSDAAARCVAAAVESKGAKALLLKADATVDTEVETLFERLPVEGLATLVCSAGVPPSYERLSETSPEEFERQWRAQAFSAALFCRRALPAMLKRKSGRIVFVVSSITEGVAPAYLASYVSAKYALLGLARALQSEVGPRGVSVSCVFPGMTQSDFIKDFPAPIVEIAREAQGSLDTPQSVARRIAELLNVESQT